MCPLRLGTDSPKQLPVEVLLLLLAYQQRHLCVDVVFDGFCVIAHTTLDAKDLQRHNLKPRLGNTSHQDWQKFEINLLRSHQGISGSDSF